MWWKDLLTFKDIFFKEFQAPTMFLNIIFVREKKSKLKSTHLFSIYKYALLLLEQFLSF